MRCNKLLKVKIVCFFPQFWHYLGWFQCPLPLILMFYKVTPDDSLHPANDVGSRKEEGKKVNYRFFEKDLLISSVTVDNGRHTKSPSEPQASVQWLSRIRQLFAIKLCPLEKWFNYSDSVATFQKCIKKTNILNP